MARKKVKKWIFRFRGTSDSTQGSTLLSVLDNHSLKVLDNNLPKMVLVSGPDEAIESAKKEIDSNWIVAPENSSYPIPDTRKKIST